MTSIVREFLRAATRLEDFPRPLHIYRPAARHPLGVPRTLTQERLANRRCTTFQNPGTPRSQKTYNECVSEFGFPAKQNEWKKREEQICVT
jgi:hypothetical protein